MLLIYFIYQDTTRIIIKADVEVQRCACMKEKEKEIVNKNAYYTINDIFVSYKKNHIKIVSDIRKTQNLLMVFLSLFRVQ
jgi:hypothetical protein